MYWIESVKDGSGGRVPVGIWTSGSHYTTVNAESLHGVSGDASSFSRPCFLTQAVFMVSCNARLRPHDGPFGQHKRLQQLAQGFAAGFSPGRAVSPGRDGQEKPRSLSQHQPPPAHALTPSFGQAVPDTELSHGLM